VVLLVFDLDGTLTDTMGDDDRLFVDALREVAGVTDQIPPWESFPEVTDPAIVRALTGQGQGSRSRDMAMMEVRTTFCMMWKQSLDSGALTVRPIAGAREIFAEADTKPGFASAIATGGWEPTARMKLLAAGFPADDLVLATADQAEERASIIRAASRLKASNLGISEFSATIVIGDGVWDARAAREIGAGFIAVASEPEKAMRMHDYGADAVIESFDPAVGFWSAVDGAMRRLGTTPNNVLAAAPVEAAR